MKFELKPLEKIIIDEKDAESCYFSNIGIGIWKDSANETEDYLTTIALVYKY